MTEPNLLFIDDDPGLRRLAERALARRGFRVTVAASGPDGVALAAQVSFDLVAVDHYMPGQDGLATLAALAALQNPPPVVYVTGSEESRIAVAALKAGAVDYVVKSVGDEFFDLLANALSQALATVQLRREKAVVEEQLREGNARLQTMLGEVNHRVANSLQLVSAFVHMQAASLQDEGARRALDDTQRRIAAIAQVHRRLYTSNAVDRVDMSDYLPAMLAEIGSTWSTPVAPRPIRVTAEKISLPTDRAVSLGIIMNELVSNACKYAYAPDQPGEVQVSLSHDGEARFALVVRDLGKGIIADHAPLGTGLGTKIIKAMVSSLQATINYENGTPGLIVRLSATL